jgi:hypothetical protein
MPEAMPVRANLKLREEHSPTCKLSLAENLWFAAIGWLLGASLVDHPYVKCIENGV